MYVENPERQEIKETGICNRCGAKMNNPVQCTTCGKSYPAKIWREEK